MVIQVDVISKYVEFNEELTFIIKFSEPAECVNIYNVSVYISNVGSKRDDLFCYGTGAIPVILSTNEFQVKILLPDILTQGIYYINQLSLLRSQSIKSFAISRE